MREELEKILYSENEEKVIYPNGDVLKFEQSDNSVNEKESTSGLYKQKTPIIADDFEDEHTRGIFDNVIQEDNKSNLGDELTKQTDEVYEQKDDDRELSWKGILAISCVLLLIILLGWIIPIAMFQN